MWSKTPEYTYTIPQPILLKKIKVKLLLNPNNNCPMATLTLKLIKPT